MLSEYDVRVGSVIILIGAVIFQVDRHNIVDMVLSVHICIAI